MPENVLITGASGLIGTHLVNALLRRGNNITALTTNYSYAKNKLPETVKLVEWGDYLALADEKIDGIINLAGNNLGEKRWSKSFKNKIRDSRIQSTKKIIDLIFNMRKKPRVLINASGVDYYGDRGNEELTEDSAPGFDFLSNVCIEWEHEAYNAEDCGTRVVIIRNGFVLAKNSEGIRRLALPFKFFIGGTYGSGEQFMSWIHIEDLVDIYLLALENAQISGSVNATSPKPVTMNEFCKNIAKAVRRPSFFRIPPFAIKIAAGESASLILNGRKVLPDKLCKSGFRFKYLNLPAALNDVIKS